MAERAEPGLRLHGLRVVYLGVLIEVLVVAVYNSRTPRGLENTRGTPASTLTARLRRECMPGCWEGCGHLEGHRTERSR
eukprot:scaffold7228_cov48-Phaeocystis_antarctica.AAC.2